MEFGSTVTKLREGRGWSQAKLAEKAGVSQETVAAWESGQEFPGQEQLLSLAMALKVKIPRLIEKDEELMVKVIEGTETYETAVMGVVSVVTAACALVLIALSHTDPDALQIAIRVTEAVLIVGLLALVWQRRGPARSAPRRSATRSRLPTAPRPPLSSSARPDATPATSSCSSCSARSSPSRSSSSWASWCPSHACPG